MKDGERSCEINSIFQARDLWTYPSHVELVELADDIAFDWALERPMMTGMRAAMGLEKQLTLYSSGRSAILHDGTLPLDVEKATKSISSVRTDVDVLYRRHRGDLHLDEFVGHFGGCGREESSG